MKKLPFLLSAILLTLSVCSPLFAKTQIIEDPITEPLPRIQERKRDYRRNGNPPPPPPRPKRTYYDSDGLFEDLISLLWLVNNGLVTFEQYPYANDDKYLHFDVSKEDDKNRFYRYSLSSGIFWLPEFSSGIETVFEGYIFKMFGPYFENTVFGDLSATTAPFSVNYNSVYGNFKIGGQFAIVQSNPLSFSIYMQWVRWYGITGQPWSNDKNGLTLGFNMRSYPFKPLTLEWKFGAEVMNPSEDTFIESDLKAGIMINRMEIYLAWKYRCYYMNETIFVKESNGLSSGLRVYF